MKNYTLDVTLYKRGFARKEEHCLFDDLENALIAENGTDGMYSATIAPVTPSLTMRIRIPCEDSNYYQSNPVLEWQYAKLLYKKTKSTGDVSYTFFYFVNSIRALANNTLEIELTCDSVNTLARQGSDKSLTFDSLFSAKTMVYREHRDRFKGGYTWTEGDYIYFVNDIDPISEGLGTFTLLKDTDKTIYDERFESASVASLWNAQKTSWLAYYGKPSNESVQVAVCLFPSNWNTCIPFKIDTTTLKQEETGTRMFMANTSVLRRNFEGTSKIIEYPYLPFYDIEIKDGETSTAYVYFKLAEENTAYTTSDASKNAFGFTGEFVTVNGQTSSDTTSGYSIGSWSSLMERVGYGYNAPIIANVNLWHGITGTVRSSAKKFMARTVNDTKLYHSDFYTEAFVYDSFIWSYNHEDCSYKAKIPSMNIRFIANVAPVSRFAFKFEPVDFTLKTKETNNVLDCSRNNEAYIGTSDYLNYLRNGFNYDVKSKALGVASSLASGLTRTAVGVATGGAVGGAVGLASSTINTLASLADAGNSIGAKMSALQAKAINVSGGDSLSVLQDSTENKLHHVSFKPNDDIKSRLNDLFYYYGYRTELQKQPKTSSRRLFNYIQADPRFSQDYYSQVRPPLWLETDFTSIIKAGITRFHRASEGTETRQGYDLDYYYENWEVSVWQYLTY